MPTYSNNLHGVLRASPKTDAEGNQPYAKGSFQFGDSSYQLVTRRTTLASGEVVIEGAVQTPYLGQDAPEPTVVGRIRLYAQEDGTYQGTATDAAGQEHAIVARRKTLNFREGSEVGLQIAPPGTFGGAGTPTATPF